MPELADLFPGFASHWIDTQAGKIFARSHGAGPALLLLHGFGQTHVAWRKIAPKLAERFTVVAMDLRGYGWSAAPESEKGEAYAKREMADDVVKVMEALGHVQFALAGHDRGARVGFRLALDHPGRLSKLALVNIAPVDDNFGASDLWRLGRSRFLSMDAPQPEELIALDPADFLDDALKDSSKDKSLDAFGPQALAHYHAAFNDPARIHAFCEDYRAGATLDKEALAADKAAGRKLLAPTLVLYGEAAFPGLGDPLLDAWKEWGDDVTGAAVDSGLYAMEEAPEATLQALDSFL
jgi:haloacetate dehalogenase